MRPTALPSVHCLNLVVSILLAALPLFSLPLAAQPPVAEPLPWQPVCRQRQPLPTKSVWV